MGSAPFLPDKLQPEPPGNGSRHYRTELPKCEGNVKLARNGDQQIVYEWSISQAISRIKDSDQYRVSLTESSCIIHMLT